MVEHTRREYKSIARGGAGEGKLVLMPRPAERRRRNERRINARAVGVAGRSEKNPMDRKMINWMSFRDERYAACGALFARGTVKLCLRRFEMDAGDDDPVAT